MLTVKEKLAKAKTFLILDHPFFGSAVMRRPIRLAPVDTACVNAHGLIRVDERFIDAITVPNTIFVLAHECMHYMLGHVHRRRGRDPRAWNIACDKVINDLLIDAKVGEPTRDGIFQDGARAFSADALYDEADKDAAAPGGIGDDIDDTEELSEAEQTEIEAQVMVELAQCAQAAKMQGKLPGALRRLVEEMLTVKVPWWDILERFMTERIRHDYSWQRPARKHVASGLYLPSLDTQPRMGEVVMAIDTSCSVSQDDMTVFQGHMNRLLETCQPTKLTVLYCDTAVRSVDEYVVEDLPARFRTPKGGGGTSFVPVFEWVMEQGVTPDCLIYLTDMMGRFPSDVPDYPVLWLSTSHSLTAPFGEVVKHE